MSDVLLQELRDLRAEVSDMKQTLVQVLKPGHQSRPLTAMELLDRWQIPGGTLADRLHNLAEKCRQRGLRRMEGTRGRHATYMIADVLKAEDYARALPGRRRPRAGR